jgi:hypothetical protein
MGKEMRLPQQFVSAALCMGPFSSAFPTMSTDISILRIPLDFHRSSTFISSRCRLSHFTLHRHFSLLPYYLSPAIFPKSTYLDEIRISIPCTHSSSKLMHLSASSMLATASLPTLINLADSTLSHFIFHVIASPTDLPQYVPRALHLPHRAQGRQ